MNKPGLGLLLGLVIVGAIAFPGAVRAEKRRIVLMEIDGARTDKLQGSVAKLLKPEHFVLSSEAYRRVAERRNATKLNPANIRKVCKELGCDGILDGVVEAEDGGYVFVVRLREGATGKIKKRIAMRLKKPRLTSDLSRGLRSRLFAAIDDLERVKGGKRNFDDDVADTSGSGGDFGDDSFGDDVEKPTRRVKKPRDGDEAVAGTTGRRKKISSDDANKNFDDTGAGFDDSGAEEVPQNLKNGKIDSSGVTLADDKEEQPSLTKQLEAEQNSAVDRREFPVAIVAGVSVQKRDLQFAFSGSLSGVQRPVPYAGSPAPGVYVRGELYPVAFVSGASSALKNFGFAFTIDRVLGLKVEAQQNGMKVQGTALQQRAEGEIRYRYNFGSKPSYPTLIGSVGYGQLQFAIGKQLNLDVPNVAYQYVNPGLTLRVPLSDSFALEAAARFMAVLNAGDIQLESQYGSAVTTGIDGDLFVETQFFQNFLVRAGAHVTRVGFDFNSNKGKADRNQDGMQDVGGAADMYLGGYITLGYRY